LLDQQREIGEIKCIKVKKLKRKSTKVKISHGFKYFFVFQKKKKKKKGIFFLPPFFFVISPYSKKSPAC
jgi:hypothetical protein